METNSNNSTPNETISSRQPVQGLLAGCTGLLLGSWWSHCEVRNQNMFVTHFLIIVLMVWTDLGAQIGQVLKLKAVCKRTCLFLKHRFYVSKAHVFEGSERSRT